jgi:hypothetical protein
MPAPRTINPRLPSKTGVFYLCRGTPHRAIGALETPCPAPGMRHPRSAASSGLADMDADTPLPDARIAANRAGHAGHSSPLPGRDRPAPFVPGRGMPPGIYDRFRPRKAAA